jgi:hypothetical protein
MLVRNDWDKLLYRKINKSNVSLYAMKTCEGRGGTVPLILNLRIKWRRMVSFIPCPLYPPYPLNRRLVVCRSWSGRFVQAKNVLSLP